MQPVVEIEIWSDVVCPWCYLGKRRFERALAGFAHRGAVRVRFRSFELDPGAAPEPEPTVPMLARKYRQSEAAVLASMQQLTRTAAAEGLEYHLPEADSGNTFDAHRLIHAAAEHGRGEELAERLFRAHFTEGRSVFDHDSLALLAEEAGLDGARAREVLAGGEYADDVRADERQARVYGATGVPFFVLDGRYGISGAQPTELFGRALEEAWSTRAPTSR